MHIANIRIYLHSVLSANICRNGFIKSFHKYSSIKYLTHKQSKITDTIPNTALIAGIQISITTFSAENIILSNLEFIKTVLSTQIMLTI
jgi:hypothetical protein